METLIFPALAKGDYDLPYYMIGTGCRYQMNTLKRENGALFYQWIQTNEGEGLIKAGDKEFILKKGQGVLLFPEEQHEIIPVSEPYYVDMVMFGGYGVKELLQHQNIKRTDCYQISDVTRVEEEIRKVFDMAKYPSLHRYLECSGVMYNFLIILLKNLLYPQQELEQRFNFKLVHNYIDENYNTLITLEDLAGLLHISPQYFCKLFKEVYGYRVFEYINGVRIRKSKEFIFNQKELKLTRIANMCGFDDTSYFCAVFKKMEGCTPGEFKKSMM